MAVKGYIVRGKHFDTGAVVWLAYEPTGEHVVVPREAQRTTFQAIGSAIQAWCDAQVMCAEPCIFAVAEDGTETALPSYEKALALVEALRKPGRTPLAPNVLTAEDRAAIDLGNVIEELLDGPCTVDDLCGAYPDTPASRMAADLAILQAAGSIRAIGPDGWELVEDAFTTARWEGCLPYARRLLAEAAGRS